MKKILMIPLAILSSLLVFLQFGCSNNNKDLKAISFKAEKAEYNYNEKINFIITLKNDNKYDVDAVVINENSYPVEMVLNDKTEYKAETDLTFSESSNVFTLQKVLYSDNGTNHELTTNKRVNLAKNKDSQSEISVIDISLIDLTNNGEFYQSDTLELSIKIKKEIENVYITGFTYLIECGSNSQTKHINITDNVNIADNKKTDVYKIKFDMPKECEGETLITLTDVDYVVGAKDCNLSNISKFTSCIVQAQKMEVISTEVIKKENFREDVNELKYFDENTTVTLEITLSNPNNLKINEISICGVPIKITNVNLFPFNGKDQEYTKMSGISIIRKTINMKDITECPTKLTLDSVTSYTDGKKVKIHAELTDDIYYYNKIINTASDFAKILNDASLVKDGKISGRYILNKDITIDNDNQNIIFFKNYEFDGVIEGNGHSINVGSTYKPLFDKIGKNGLIQNVDLEVNAHDNSVICNTNEGTIRNINFGGTVNVEPKENCSFRKEGLVTYDELADIYVLCETNNGTISDVNFVSTINGSHVYISLIKNNNGDFSKIIVNPIIRTISNTFLPLPSYNNGNLSEIVLTLNHWFDGVQSADVAHQNKLILWSYGDISNLNNIILNDAFRKKIETLNKIIDGPQLENGSSSSKEKEHFEEDATVIASSIIQQESTLNPVSDYKEELIKPRVLVIPSESFSAQYYAQLGFRKYSSSNNSFWRTNGTEISLNWDIK